MLSAGTPNFELEDNSSSNFGTDDPAQKRDFATKPQQPLGIYTARPGAWSIPLNFSPHLSSLAMAARPLPDRPPTLSPPPDVVPTIWSYFGHPNVAALSWYLIKGQPFNSDDTSRYLHAIAKGFTVMQHALRSLSFDSIPKRFWLIWDRYRLLLEFLGEVPAVFLSLLRAPVPSSKITIGPDFAIPAAPDPRFPEEFNFAYRVPLNNFRLVPKATIEDSSASSSKPRPRAVMQATPAGRELRPRDKPSSTASTPETLPAKRKRDPSPEEYSSGTEDESPSKAPKAKKVVVIKGPADKGKGRAKSKPVLVKEEPEAEETPSASEAETEGSKPANKRRRLDPSPSPSNNRPEVKRELKEPKLQRISDININKATDAFKKALTAKIASHKDNGPQAFHINLDLGEESPFVAIIRKEASYTGEFFSQLAPEELMHPNPDEPYTTSCDPFPLIPTEQVTAMDWPNAGIPAFGCLLCLFLNRKCIPTGFGGPCGTCVRFRFRRCEHRKTLEAMTSMFAELSSLYSAASDVTSSVIQQAAASFVRSRRARIAYDFAQKEAHEWFRHLMSHVFHCIEVLGVSAFQERFISEAGEPVVTEALQVMIDRYNLWVQKFPDAAERVEKLPVSEKDLGSFSPLRPLFTMGGVLREITEFLENALGDDDPTDDDPKDADEEPSAPEA
ncbi:hypothetical protein C8F04DRAFT_1257656 [Mycena alexandri]|uniref:Uncharacterized protein n=1 Tax=Mycena alexandri TaxID=1745969 RepID=A0AAD6T3R7_9AGAR|nr:hypothetical protein C8F04DRAFT_1257656 [Mycena alexandri]